MRGVRYGEVLGIFARNDELVGEVYGTQMINDCPQDLWEKLDAAEIAKDLGSLFVKLNGPRHWMLDGLGTKVATIEPVMREFNGLLMRRIATIDLGAGFTPLVRAHRLAAELGLGEVWVKNDTLNPTNSFKDRVVNVALAKALEFGGLAFQPSKLLPQDFHLAFWRNTLALKFSPDIGDFLERHAKRLRETNHRDNRHIALAEMPIRIATSFSTHLRQEQALANVEPNRIRAEPGPPREFTDQHLCIP